MIPAQPIDVRSLLRLEEGLVHSDVYRSPEIFDLEMERIFHDNWVYVGHESEIPNRGDFALRTIGRQSVIMNRDHRGQVNLFMNRCRHRANSVCQYDSGNAANFFCNYHGWTYKNSGELIGVPYADAYGDDFDKKSLPLVKPRMEMYRGFIWGNLGKSEGSLMDHLGIAGKRGIDMFCDASPEGEVIVRQGSTKVKIYANWKFQGGDGYHPAFTHRANFMAIRHQRKSGGMKNDMAPGTMEEGYLSRDLGNGHSCLDTRSAGQSYGVRLPDAQWARDYRASMVKAYGQERAEYLLKTGGNPHILLSPNLQLLQPDIRVIRPISATEFDITFYCAFLKGVPDELNQARVRDTEDRMGPAGSINPDDVDMFERNQFGLQQTVNPWKFMGRGIEREHPDNDEGTIENYRLEGSIVGHYSDEVTQRGQLRWWADRLTQA